VDTGRCVAYDSALEWSPAGGRILFIGPDPAAPDVTVGVSWSLDTISPDGSDPTTLTTGPPSSGFPGETELVGGEPSPQWSPDGSEIAFDLHNGIYIINADGTGLSRLVATGGQPAWSPDGTRLLYETFGAPPASLSRLWSRHIELWIINADGSDNRLLYRYPWPIGENGASWDAHVWSPDGKQIAFSTRSPSGAPSDTEAGAFVMNANGSDLHRIARGGWPVLAWRPVP
jgi:Tol biopolymer transport system component